MLSKQGLNFIKKSFSSEKDFIYQASFISSDAGLAKILKISEERILVHLARQSGIEDVFSLVARRRSLLLSYYLMNESEKLSQEKIIILAELWKKEGRTYYPFEGGFSYLYDYVARVLEKLKEKNFVRQLEKFFLPLSHPKAEQVVRSTLQLPDTAILSQGDVTRVLLTALFQPLRQNVGSCFATAPAILVQEEQKETFLEDLQQLLFRGKLQRVYQGQEYSVPWNPSPSFPEFHRELFTEHAAYPVWESPSFLYACQKSDLFPSDAKSLEDKIKTLLKDKTIKTLDDLTEALILQRMRKSSRDEESNEEKKKFKEFFSSFSSNPLLKTWEYTVASFSDAKTDFSEWNLYISLGLAHDALYGVGEVIYQFAQKKLQSYETSMQQYQQEYEEAFDRVKLTESLLKQAYKESEIRRLKAEHQMGAYHLNSCLERREEAYAKGKWFTGFFNFLTKEYQSRFVHYFQEIYDPELLEEVGKEYDDSPAGFRLVCKHGRTDPSVWTKITNGDEYTKALTSFFIASEPLISAICEEDFQKKAIEEVTTEIINLIRSDAFIEKSLTRSKLSRIHPETIYKTPWSYVSGGSMFSLLRTYFRQPKPVTLEQSSLESPFDLAHFLLETMKSLPPRITSDFEAHPEYRMLMHSPTHAFSFLPGLHAFKKAWQANLFTYTWLRDQLVMPAEQFYDRIVLTGVQQQFLLDLFCEKFPLQISRYLQNAYVHSSVDFASFQINLLQAAKECLGPSIFESFKEQLDRFFFISLPLTKGQDLLHHIRLLLEDELDENLEEVLLHLPRFSPFIDSTTLRELAKTCFVLSRENAPISFDLDAKVLEKARKYGLCAPEPLLFADTNWSFYYFSFMYSPIDKALQIWRMNPEGSDGAPMGSWNRSLDKSHPEVWAVCPFPYEYRL